MTASHGRGPQPEAGILEPRAAPPDERVHFWSPRTGGPTWHRGGSPRCSASASHLPGRIIDRMGPLPVLGRRQRYGYSADRDDCGAWAASGARAAVGRTTTIADGGCQGPGLVVPDRRSADRTVARPPGARDQLRDSPQAASTAIRSRLLAGEWDDLGRCPLLVIVTALGAPSTWTTDPAWHPAPLSRWAPTRPKTVAAPVETVARNRQFQPLWCCAHDNRERRMSICSAKVHRELTAPSRKIPISTPTSSHGRADVTSSHRAHPPCSHPSRTRAPPDGSTQPTRSPGLHRARPPHRRRTPCSGRTVTTAVSDTASPWR